MNNDRPITLLWAVRSHCDLGCDYCYYGEVADHQIAPPTKPGQLSHVSPNDMKRREVLAFAETLPGSAVGRIFLAGGEPLNWPGILELIELIKQAGIEVVVCTNGIPLTRPVIVERLLELGVDAVSISLDSTDPAANDAHRPSRDGQHGWHDVVAGTRALIAARGQAAYPKVGLYSVVTHESIDEIIPMGHLARDLGVDYYVPQPVALDEEHKLHATLSLRADDTPRLHQALTELYEANLPLVLPDTGYPQQVASTVDRTTATAPGCFGGHTLFFVQPDGATWDCPSSLRIDATDASARRSIRGADAAEIFPAPRGCAADCPLFSFECVNMWPLMDFTRITAHERSDA
ncbi:MAG: radical SAM protein [Pseudonocardiaceae bacterium]